MQPYSDRTSTIYTILYARRRQVVPQPWTCWAPSILGLRSRWMQQFTNSCNPHLHDDMMRIGNRLSNLLLMGTLSLASHNATRIVGNFVLYIVIENWVESFMHISCLHIPTSRLLISFSIFLIVCFMLVLYQIWSWSLWTVDFVYIYIFHIFFSYKKVEAKQIIPPNC